MSRRLFDELLSFRYAADALPLPFIEGLNQLFGLVNL